MADIDPRAITFVYRNHERKVQRRVVVPTGVRYGSFPFHEDEGEQWVLDAFDLVKSAQRTFALKNILSVFEKPTQEMLDGLRERHINHTGQTPTTPST